MLWSLDIYWQNVCWLQGIYTLWTGMGLNWSELVNSLWTGMVLNGSELVNFNRKQDGRWQEGGSGWQMADGRKWVADARWHILHNNTKTHNIEKIFLLIEMSQYISLHSPFSWNRWSWFQEALFSFSYFFIFCSPFSFVCFRFSLWECSGSDFIIYPLSLNPESLSVLHF